MNKAAPFERRNAVLRLLAKHGALSIRALEASLSPPISRKKLNEVLVRMHRANLVHQRNSYIFGGRGVFYELPHEVSSKQLVAKILDVPIKDVSKRAVANFYLLHSESCAVWAEFLSHFLLGSTLINERDFSQHAAIQSVLMTDLCDRDFIPDLMLIAPSFSGEESIYIAVEVERSPKSRDRLVRKLQRYAEESRVDGVIYICESNYIFTRLRDAYESTVLGKSLRVRHFGANFVLFTDSTVAVGGSEPIMHNASFDPVSLRDWLDTLQRVPMLERRDFKFKGRGAHHGLTELEKREEHGATT